MKKILQITILSILFFTVGMVFARSETDDLTGLGADLNITTYTSEPCGIAGEGAGFCTGSGQLRRCKCTVSAGSGFITFIASIYKYLFFISLVIGVFMIVVLGIGMSISGFSEELQSQSKKKIFEILAGLFALSMIPWILKTIAPFFFE
jgi:hypothetical protein